MGGIGCRPVNTDQKLSSRPFHFLLTSGRKTQVATLIRACNKATSRTFPTKRKEVLLTHCAKSLDLLGDDWLRQTQKKTGVALWCGLASGQCAVPLRLACQLPAKTHTAFSLTSSRFYCTFCLSKSVFLRFPSSPPASSPSSALLRVSN